MRVIRRLFEDDLAMQTAIRLIGVGTLLMVAVVPLAGQEPDLRDGVAVLVERDVRIQVGDGITLAADVFRPEQAEPVPALLIVSPYSRTQIQNRAEAWALRGYAVVFVDSRGTFGSEGEYYPYVNEGRDAFDVQQWIGRQPWSDGKVGMWGKSYPAFIELLSAPFGSPHLQAVIPVSSQSDNFSNIWYSNGLLNLGIAFFGAMYLGGRFATINPEAINWMELVTRLPVKRTLDEEGLGSAFVADVIRHSTYDDFWRAMSIQHRYGEMDVPALHVGGWYDPNVHETFVNFTNMRDSSVSARSRRWQRLIMGPWSHASREIWFPAVSSRRSLWMGALVTSNSARRPPWTMRTSIFGGSTTISRESTTVLRASRQSGSSSWERTSGGTSGSGPYPVLSRRAFTCTAGSRRGPAWATVG